MKRLLKGKIKYIMLAVVAVISISMMSKGGKGITVDSYPVESGNVEKYVEEVGEFSAINTYKINGRTMGIVEKIHRTEGGEVKEGDILIELDNKNISLEIKSLEAQIAGVYAELAEASDIVDKEKISQLKSRITMAQNNYIEKKELYETSIILYDSHAISKSELDKIKRDYENSLESLNIAKEDLSLLSKGISSHQKEQYQKRIEVLSYQLEMKKREYNHTIIKSPGNGRVTDKFVEIGDAVQLGTPLIEITEPGDYKIKADVLASDAGQMKLGSRVIITDPEGDRQWKGSITKIFPKAFSKVSDLGIEQKRVKIEIDPENMEFDQYGYEFDLKIILNSKENVLRIKENSIFKISEDDHVYTIENNQLLLQKVTLGLEGEDYVEVLEGLTEGDLVVPSPGNDLEEGLKVNID